MGHLQSEQEVTQVADSELSQKESTAKKHWQAWHYLIPGLTVFWIIFGIILFTGDFLFFSALAILAVCSVLIVVLAWAYQNNV